MLNVSTLVERVDELIDTMLEDEQRFYLVLELAQQFRDQLAQIALDDATNS